MSTKQALEQKLDCYLRSLLPDTVWKSRKVLDLKHFDIEVHSWGLYQASENSAWVTCLDRIEHKIPVIAKHSNETWTFRVPSVLLGIDVPHEKRFQYVNTELVSSEQFSLLVTNNVLSVTDSPLGCISTWIPTYTGKAFNPFYPDINAICIEDIAHQLSVKCRFVGAPERLYSVGEHSLMVSYLVHPNNAKWALLHDAAEAYLVDMPKPIKVMFPEYTALENNVQQAVCKRFGLSLDMPIEVKEADTFAQAREGEYFCNKGVWDGFWQAEFAEFMHSIRDRGWDHDWNDYFYFHQPPNNSEVKELFLDRAKELGIK